MGIKTFEIIVNGASHQVTVDEDTPLIYVLRNDLGLKGSRLGCGTGHCGSCTVLLNEQPVQSCSTPIWAVAGHSCKTIEGLGLDAQFNLLRDSFLEEQAAQCGYCINGILISCYAILKKSPSATRQDIVQALDRHLCRCGVHARVIKAVCAVQSQGAEAMKEGLTNMTSSRHD